MKKIFGLAMLALLSVPAIRLDAQFIRNTAQRPPAGWQNGSYANTGFYGADVDGAYELLAGRPSAKTVTVALIGYGIDVDNDDIRPQLWTNPGERPDGKDNDRNGLIDDIHGWNFLGTQDGRTLDTISRAADREFVRLMDKYSDYHKSNGRFYKYDPKRDRLVEVKPPKDVAEYDYFRNEVVPDSPAGSRYLGVKLSQVITSYMREFEREMRAKFPDKTLTREDFHTIIDSNSTDTMKLVAYTMTEMAFNFSRETEWDKMYDYQLMSTERNSLEQARRQLAALRVDERILIGDNPDKLRDRKYGNNLLMADNAGFGTMQAGLIGATRGNGRGIDGIASDVRIMTLRVDADFFGEPYMKDMALAIRYAVDNGADIIQLGKTNTFYPRPHHQWVDDALKYAEQRGVLVVIPMMDLSYDVSQTPFYPNRNLREGHRLENVITVAASDAAGNPALKANFSQTELDLFAPGVELTSTYLGNSTASGSGSYLAASVVTGVAALVKGYYPSLTPAQLRRVLMDSVTPRGDAEVEKEYNVIRNGTNRGGAKDLFLFDELSVSGGIVNARRALELAAGQN